MNKQKQIAVVVTTEHRGVFFGYVDAVPDLDQTKSVKVNQARMCVYWSAETHGVVGLAVEGPASGCKISPAALEITLAGVTAVMKCTDDAVEAWESEPWS